MLVIRGPQGRLVLPTEPSSLNKVISYLLTYLQINGCVQLNYLLIKLLKFLKKRVDRSISSSKIYNTCTCTCRL